MTAVAPALLPAVVLRARTVLRIASFGAYALVSLGVVPGRDRSRHHPARQRLPAIGERIGYLGLPTAFVFEGGYAVDEIGINVVNVLEGFETAA